MSEKHTLTGTITHKMDLQTFKNDFTKREFVVCDDAEKYPQEIKLELLKDKCAILDKIPLNSKVTVHFNIRGNEYKDKFYVNLQAWKIDVLEQHSEPTAQREMPVNRSIPQNRPESAHIPDDESDVPF